MAQMCEHNMRNDMNKPYGKGKKKVEHELMEKKRLNPMAAESAVKDGWLFETCNLPPCLRVADLPLRQASS
jgi:hypothetical protein